jgi:hypothetical protein
MERSDRRSKIGKNSNPYLAAENHHLARQLLFKNCSHSKVKTGIGYGIAKAWHMLNKYLLN